MLLIVGGALDRLGYQNLSIHPSAADYNMSPFDCFIQPFGPRAMRQVQEYDSIDNNCQQREWQHCDSNFAAMPGRWPGGRANGE